MWANGVLGRYLDEIEGGEAVSRELLAEIDHRFDQAGISRRRFFTELVQPYVVSSAAWSRWVSGTHPPTRSHFIQLLPYFRRYLGLSEQIVVETVEVTRAQGQQTGDAFGAALRSATHDELVAMTEAAILLGNEAEFPSNPGRSGRQRRGAILLLSVLAKLMEDEDDERSLLGAEAGMTLAMLLSEVGQYEEAQRRALGAAYTLVDAPLDREPIGYPGLTYGELLVHSYMRAGTAARQRGDDRKTVVYTKSALEYAAEVAAPRRHRLQIGLQREVAKVHLASGRVSQAEDAVSHCLGEFGKLRVSDDPILFYLTLETMARVQTAQGRHDTARALLRRAEELEDAASPGPVHRALLLQRKAALLRRRGELEEWRVVLTDLVDLALSAGLEDQVDKVRRGLERITHDEQPYVSDLRERLSAAESAKVEEESTEVRADKTGQREVGR